METHVVTVLNLVAGAVSVYDYQNLLRMLVNDDAVAALMGPANQLVQGMPGRYIRFLDLKPDNQRVPLTHRQLPALQALLKCTSLFGHPFLDGYTVKKKLADMAEALSAEGDYVYPSFVHHCYD